MLVHDAATFHLNSGDLHLLQPVDGRTIGAVWIGEGRFLMEAPIEVERAQLRRFYQSDDIDQVIRRAVFFFTDDVDSVFPGVTWEARPPPNDARREVEEAMKYLSDGDGWMHRDLALPMLNNTSGFFYAHVAEGRGDPLIFTVTPFDAEEVSLSKRARREQTRETVAQFYRQQDHETGRSVYQEGLDLIRIGHYEIATTVERNLDFSARATLSIQRIRDGFDWIPFRLYSELEVDSILWGNGTAATFVRPEESSDLWVDFGSAPADATSLTFFYQGDLFDRFRNLWVEMRSTTLWLPVYEYGRPATYRMTFYHHERYKVAAVGSKVSESPADDDDMVTTTWETPIVRQVTFNLGRFTEREAGDARFPNLTVQVDEAAHRELIRVDAVLLIRQRDMTERVALDLANSFLFFEQVYGPTTVSEFTASEIPYDHGEAYAGLVLLSWSTFQWTSERGYDEMFRAHEVAHQWWGIGVRPATYHDQWLSEGFAEFSGLWYMGRVRGSHEMFMRRLKETREEITDRRDEAAPICLGTRAGTSRDPEDYALTVYQKGAWVLHMLRVLLTDPETGSDAAFEAMIKEFYTTYFGQTATTEQFMAVVEKHVGIPMDWFLDQWVYGTGIPEYRFSYNLQELPSGEYRATVRVRQEKVPDTFQMIVPIYLDFGVAGHSQVNIMVTGPETVTELPLLPMEPEDIVFNPFESVLAEVRTERWQN